ncbi:DUF732 domain-containing protein [Mycobacterium sp.]|uniref:DUF732 domain-containing protein n=1 Tax=Mycobacterium sp. TaxID=1785 RepID=UPI003BACFE12
MNICVTAFARGAHLPLLCDDQSIMRFLLTAIGAAAAIGMAAPAHADTIDQQFLDALRQAGLTYQDANLAIAAGKSVCKLVSQGKHTADVVTVVQKGNPGLHGNSAAKFTAIAATAYCPTALSSGAGASDKPTGG